MRILHDIHLEVEPGERVGIVGLNGHGKTTLLRAIMGLVDWQQGEIDVFGRSVVGMPTHRLVRAGIVLIPQGDTLFPGLSVLDNLDSGAFARGSWSTRSDRRDRVLALFPRLSQRLQQPAGVLSGGERRMLSIGRCLMADARVYLVDEPSLGLGVGIARGIAETLLSLELGGGAMLVAEQNRALIEGRIDRLLRMHGGRIVPDQEASDGERDHRELAVREGGPT
jgi:branched-chain amino acid transport system ATP-binding protein